MREVWSFYSALTGKWSKSSPCSCLQSFGVGRGECACVEHIKECSPSLMHSSPEAPKCNRLNALTINSESPILNPCLGKNQSTSSWCHLTKSEPRFALFTSCSLCLMSSVYFLNESESVLSCEFITDSN